MRKSDIKNYGRRRRDSLRRPAANDRVLEVSAVLVYLQMIETEEESSKFEAIYREYRDLLLFLADRRLRNPQDAEDAVHEVFVKLAENIRRVETVI